MERSDARWKSSDPKLDGKMKVENEPPLRGCLKNERVVRVDMAHQVEETHSSMTNDEDVRAGGSA